MTDLTEAFNEFKSDISRELGAFGAILSRVEDTIQKLPCLDHADKIGKIHHRINGVDGKISQVNHTGRVIGFGLIGVATLIGAVYTVFQIIIILRG